MRTPRSQPIQAVLFDFFGTLTPGVSGHQQKASHRRVAKALGVSAPAYVDAAVASWPDRCTGRLGDLPATLRWLARQCGGSPDSAAVADACRERRRGILQQAKLRPEVVWVCRALRQEGLRLGLVSDCTHELPELWGSLPISEYFDAATFSIVVARRKPDPAMYLSACQSLHVLPERCLYVGDGGGREFSGATSIGMWAVQLAAPDGVGALVHDREEGWQGDTVTRLSAILPLVKLEQDRRAAQA